MKHIKDIAGKLFGHRYFRRVTYAVLAFVLVLTASAASFAVHCGGEQADFQPILEGYDGDPIEGIDGYYRTEETTYITFPEWYLVFNPQEYAIHMASETPSTFPYFLSIKQFWSGYCQVYGVTQGAYPFNMGNHVVETVIGMSFTVEYVTKGIYENLVGRLSEAFATAPTQEDIYAARIASEYGHFIPTEPWYKFPFTLALRELWTETDFFGNDQFRKWERKAFLSLEYGIKAMYAWLIGLGSNAAFGTAAELVYARVEGTPSEAYLTQETLFVRDLDDGTSIIALPHYQGFTDTVPTLAAQGVNFIDVAGNDEMLMTVTAPMEWKYAHDNAKELFSMPMVADASKKRVAMQVPIRSLSEVLNSIKSEGNVAVEHLFDY